MADEENDDELVNPDMPYSEYYEIQPVMADMIQQFKSGVFNKVLASAIDGQLEELRQACYSISAYVNLVYGKGKILDDLGDALNLTRAQAALLVSTEELMILSDEDYRKYLQYKALLNTSQGTYEDIVNEIKLILGDDYYVSFGESGEQPATVIVEIDSENGTELDKLPVLKPAGVELDYSNGAIRTEIHIAHKTSDAQVFGICCGMVHLTDKAHPTLYNDNWRCGQYSEMYKEEIEAEGKNIYDV